ncbi:Hsp20 family protein (plasmid) [Pseudomonas silesiensis]|uniref:Hsp20 family protein n=1 Tax=Pseudomonas silesiensis TaxID=1853130 RepID=UPI0030D0CB88
MKHHDIFYAISSVALADFFQRQLARTTNACKVFAFPPTDVIAHDGGHFEVQMALAGYSLDLLDIEVKGNHLTITGKAPEGASEEANFFARGIARREFERTMEFPQLIEVKEATFINGLLVVKLNVIVPDSQKARKVPINS